MGATVTENESYVLFFILQWKTEITSVRDESYLSQGKTESVCHARVKTEK